MNSIFNRGQIIEGSTATLLARVTRNDGEYLTQADVGGITATVIDLDTDESTGTVTLDPTECVTDSLTLDNRWNVDQVGFNFTATIDGQYFPQGSRTYRVEITIDPAFGSEFLLVWLLQAAEVSG